MHSPHRSGPIGLTIILAAALLSVGLKAVSASSAVGAPFFSLDPASPSAAFSGPASVIGLITTALTGVELSSSALGLTPGQNVDALSDGKDWVDPLEPCPTYVDPLTGNVSSTLYFWSVDRNSVGADEGDYVISAGALCIAEGAPVPPELPDDGAAGDIFVQVWNADPLVPNPLERYNFKYRDDSDLGLKGLPAPLDEIDALIVFGNLETNDDDTPDANLFFSVDAATAAALGASPADILVLPSGSGPAGRTTYASAAALGLQAGDDVDALCVHDNDALFANGSPLEKLALSLTPGSPSLAGGDGLPGTADDYSPADIFRVGVNDPFPGSGLQVPFITAEFLSLLPADNVDGFDCRLGDPGPEIRTPTPTLTPHRPYRVHLPLVGNVWNLSLPMPTATATRTPMPLPSEPATATPTRMGTHPAQPTLPAEPTGTTTPRHP